MSKEYGICITFSVPKRDEADVKADIEFLKKRFRNNASWSIREAVRRTANKLREVEV